MLRDEFKTNKAASDLIARQTEEFERRGGSVASVPQGASGLNGSVIFIPECKGATPINCTTAAFAEKGRKGAAANAKLSRSVMLQEANKKHVTVRTNIRRTPSGQYELIISAVYYGLFDDVEAALDERQSKRKLLNMTFVRREK